VRFKVASYRCSLSTVVLLSRFEELTKCICILRYSGAHCVPLQISLMPLTINRIMRVDGKVRNSVLVSVPKGGTLITARSFEFNVERGGGLDL